MHTGWRGLGRWLGRCRRAPRLRQAPGREQARETRHVHTTRTQNHARQPPPSPASSAIIASNPSMPRSDITCRSSSSATVRHELRTVPKTGDHERCDHALSAPLGARRSPNLHACVSIPLGSMPARCQRLGAGERGGLPVGTLVAASHFAASLCAQPPLCGLCAVLPQGSGRQAERPGRTPGRVWRLSWDRMLCLAPIALPLCTCCRPSPVR